MFHGEAFHSAIRMVLEEEVRQEQLWGKIRNLHPELWMLILGEEYGEAQKAILQGDVANYLEELTHTTAVGLAAITDFLYQEKNAISLPISQIIPTRWAKNVEIPKKFGGLADRIKSTDAESSRR